MRRLPRYHPLVGWPLIGVGCTLDIILGLHAFLAAPVMILVLLWAVYGHGHTRRPAAPVQRPAGVGGHIVPVEYGSEVARELRRASAFPRGVCERHQRQPPTAWELIRGWARRARWTIGRGFWQVGVWLAPHLRYERED